MARPGRTALLAAAAALLGLALAAGVWIARGGSEEQTDALPLAETGPKVLFDDFDHADVAALGAAGWVTGPGGAGVSLAAARGEPGARVLRLTASTDGTAQALVCQTESSREGTSAARIRLRDGPALDAIVEAFAGGSFAFEYRPPVLELAAPNGEPLRLRGSRAGWRTLVAQVARREVVYFVDGRRVGTLRGRSRPGAAPLVLGLGLEGVAQGRPRTYDLEVDWVFHQADAVLSPAQVTGAVASLRRIGIRFQDSLQGRATAGSPCEAG